MLSRRGLALALLLGIGGTLCAQTAPAASPWWRPAVIYEVYPAQLRGFEQRRHRDWNGIASKLDFAGPGGH